MGHKKIWDGDDLPETGDEVLIHLSSSKAYVRHIVSRVGVRPLAEKGAYAVEVHLVHSKDPRSSKNMRFLQDVFALDTDPLDLPVEGCLPTPRESARNKESKANG